MWPGQKVACSTTRTPSGGGKPATQLANLTARKVTGYLLHPITSQEDLVVSDQGVDIAQLRKVYIDWPAGSTDPWPIKPMDALVLPSGTYPVKGVQVYQNHGLVVTVQISYPS